MPGFQMRTKLGITIKPPESGIGENQEAGSFLPERFQVGNGLSAVLRVIACIQALFGAGEMPGAAAVQIQPRILPLADYGDSAVSRQEGVENLPGLGDLLRMAARVGWGSGVVPA